MKKVLSGISRALCVMTVCVLAGCSYAGSGDTNNNPPAEPETYTVTFDANGHGTAPAPITDKLKGETITLPELTESGYTFDGWTNGKNNFAALTEYKVTSDVTFTAKWIGLTPPADITNLTATCTASQTIKLTWTNPTDADFAKVVITYGTDGKVEVLKTATPNNEATIIGLINGTEYTFTVKAYDEGGNASSGVSVKKTPEVSRGGLSGTPTQKQGAVVKETWMNSTTGNLMLDDGMSTGTKVEIAKTSEVVAVPTGTYALITIPDDTSWSEYIESGASTYWKGVFLKDRKVKLDPFVMSQYQVTQKLYMQVMGLNDAQNPSSFNSSPATNEVQENRPVESITWYQACAFCNELTKKTFGNTDQCVYYNKDGSVYTIADANKSTDEDRKVVIEGKSYDTTTHKWTKIGYRLPTEAEWEFCARGGDPNAKDNNQNLIWNFAYAGVQTEKEPSKFTSSPYNDEKLDDYGWNGNNSSSKTHEVGKKAPNTLGLYDMSGNVWEWCYDAYDYSTNSPTSNDTAYTTGDYVINPLGASASFAGHRSRRGGSYFDDAYYCSVSYRYCNCGAVNAFSFDGFRVCRSSN